MQQNYDNPIIGGNYETIDNQNSTNIGTNENDSSDSEAEITEIKLSKKISTSSNSTLKNRDSKKAIFIPNMTTILKSAYISIIAIACIVLCILMSTNTCNAIHIFCWIAAFASIGFLAHLFYILLFSTNLHKYRAIMSAVPGTNIHVPSRIIFCERESWRSLSQMIHVRGSSQQAFVSSMVDIGSLMAMSAAILRLFDIYDENEGKQLKSQIIGCYFLLFAGMGGVLMTFMRLEVSVSFSNLVNLISKCIHLFGAILYSLVGSLALVIYNDADWLSVLLLVLFIFGSIVWQTCRRLLPLESDDCERVHYISRVNIATEVSAVTVSAFAMILLCYQMGNDSCE